MRERDFVNRNKEKWQELEVLLEEKQVDPSELGELFVKISDDLSYAQTFYRFRSVRVYLNTLARKIFDSLYKRRKVRRSDFTRFWVEDLPLLVYEARGAMLLAFSFFALSVLIGTFSSIHDPDFARYILGDIYVEMTEENIASGDPMAVYRDKDPLGMTMGIALNNLWVDLLTFFSGLFAGIGSLVVLLYNGIMVGAFQYFFIERGLFWQSFLTIWLHGTLEMSAAVIAAAAGLTMGFGLLFPGTLSRMKAFRQSARRGIQILMGIVPLTLIAAFVEGFFSRYTHAPQWIRFFFILLCLVFVLYYYVYLPIKVGRRRKEFVHPMERLAPDREKPICYDEPRKGGELFVDAFAFFRKYSRSLLLFLLRVSFFVPLSFLVVRFFTLWLDGGEVNLDRALQDKLFVFNFFEKGSGAFVWLSAGLYVLAMSLLALFVGRLFFEDTGRTWLYPKLQQKFALSMVGLSPFMFAVIWLIFVVGEAAFMLNFVGMSLVGLGVFIAIWEKPKGGAPQAFWRLTEVMRRGFAPFLILTLSMGLIGLFFFLFLQTNLVYLLLDFVLSIFFVADASLGDSIVDWLSIWLYLFVFLLYFSLTLIAMGQLYFSVREIHSASVLRAAIKRLGEKRRIRGLEKEEGQDTGIVSTSIFKTLLLLVFFYSLSFCFQLSDLSAQKTVNRSLNKERWEILTKTVDYPPLSEGVQKAKRQRIDRERERRSAELWIAVFRVLGLILLIVLIVWGVASLMAGEPLFMPQKRKLEGRFAQQQEFKHLRAHLKKADIETPLAEAERHKNYELAVRLAYLRALQLLVQKKLVEWKKDKTNGEFLQELSGTAFFHEFFDLTRIFDYTKYGEYPVDEQLYAFIKERFKRFFAELQKVSPDL